MSIKNNFEALQKNWSWYNEQLRDIDESLYSQKEQFKMGLMAPRKSNVEATAKEPETEDEEKADDEKEVDTEGEAVEAPAEDDENVSQLDEERFAVSEL